jgi:hypothetical protein
MATARNDVFTAIAGRASLWRRRFPANLRIKRNLRNLRINRTGNECHARQRAAAGQRLRHRLLPAARRVPRRHRRRWRQDIVTGKRYWAHNGHDPDERGHRVIYWYQTKRDGKGGVDFVPHLVDAESGVGVDVQVGDVNGDKLPDIVVGNKAGVFILTQERKDTTADLTPKKLYGPALKPQAEYAKGQSPADALKSMQLPGGFKAELIAAEPDLVQPMAFTFDERGRIWVVEGNSYPKPREVGKGQDRIKILEDKTATAPSRRRKSSAKA